MPGTGRAASGRVNTTCLLLASLLFAARSLAAIPPVEGPSTAAPANEPTVRVRLTSIDGAFTVSGMDLRYVGGPGHPAPFQAIRVLSKRLTGVFSEWTIEDRDRGTLIGRVRARSFEVSGRNLRLNLKPIPGRLSLLPRGKRLEVIAEIDLEAYVRGVLPAEMPKSWPLEALKAQAIAARTFALFRKGARPLAQQEVLGYDLEATVMDQMYLFPDETSGLENVDRAVRETRAMVLLAPSERPAPLAAYFHADCGGRTEDAKMVWGAPGAGTAVDGGCPLNPLAKWTVALTLDDLAARLRTIAGKSAASALTGLIIAGRTASGRVSELRLAWSDGGANQLSAHDFRMAVGHERIKSTNFDLEIKGKNIAFSGKGFGHGVGLCQWGARALAKGGADFRKILHHYYPHSTMATTAAFNAKAAQPVALNR